MKSSINIRSSSRDSANGHIVGELNPSDFRVMILLGRLALGVAKVAAREGLVPEAQRQWPARASCSVRPFILTAKRVSRRPDFRAIPSLKQRTILMLAYGAGLRVGEA